MYPISANELQHILISCSSAKTGPMMKMWTAAEVNDSGSHHLRTIEIGGQTKQQKLNMKLFNNRDKIHANGMIVIFNVLNEAKHKIYKNTSAKTRKTYDAHLMADISWFSSFFLFSHFVNEPFCMSSISYNWMFVHVVNSQLFLIGAKTINRNFSFCVYDMLCYYCMSYIIVSHVNLCECGLYHSIWCMYRYVLQRSTCMSNSNA